LLALVGLGLAVALSIYPSLLLYRTTRPDYRLKAGQDALLGGDMAEAEEIAGRLEASGYPDHAHLLKGQIYLRQHHLNEAIREYNEIRHADEEIIAEASDIYGLAFLSQGELQRAQQLFPAVLMLRPENLDARKGLASLYYDQGAMDLALRQLERWAELDPADGQPRRFLARIYHELEEPQRAIQEYQAALALSLTPKVREEVTVELAELLIGRKAFADALALLDGCPFESVGPEVVDELRAECLAGLGRCLEAARILQGLTSERLAAPRMLRVQARVESAAGKWNSAAELLQKALQFAAHDIAGREQLALVYEHLGRRADSEHQRRLLAESRKLYKTYGDLKRMANRRANDAEVRRQLASIAELLGRQEWVERWFRAAALCPSQDKIQDE